MALDLHGVQERILPTEGRGDPTSTMLWSPRKHAGFKRPLEVEEEVISEEEEESDSEEAEIEIEMVRLVSAANECQTLEQEPEYLRVNEGREANRGEVTGNSPTATKGGRDQVRG